jgi:hypothetical protein
VENADRARQLLEWVGLETRLALRTLPEGAVRLRYAVDSGNVMEAAEATPQIAPALPSHKWLVALAVMIGCAIEVIDSSIVNVSLPHMQGSFSASLDEIAWVLTS